MMWQLAIVVLIVGAAAVYLVRQTWRTWSGAGCRGGCGCSRTPVAPPEGKVTLIPADQLTLRRREGKG